jgi:hypothetical protein
MLNLEVKGEGQGEEDTSNELKSLSEKPDGER